MKPAALEMDPAEWRDEALAWIQDLAHRGGVFSVEDIRRHVPEPHHPNQWGIAFGIARRKGWIVYWDSQPSSTRARKHGRTARWVGMSESERDLCD